MVDALEGELAQHIHAVTQQSAGGDRWINFSIDPRSAEVIGSAIAARAAEYDPQLVVTWTMPDESVLAHIVARILGVSSARADSDLGLITMDRELPPNSRVVLLTTIDDAHLRLNSLNTLLVESGHVVVAAASVVSISSPLIDSDAPQFQLSEDPRE